VNTPHTASNAAILAESRARYEAKRAMLRALPPGSGGTPVMLFMNGRRRDDGGMIRIGLEDGDGNKYRYLLDAGSAAWLRDDLTRYLGPAPSVLPDVVPIAKLGGNPKPRIVGIAGNILRRLLGTAIIAKLIAIEINPKAAVRLAADDEGTAAGLKAPHAGEASTGDAA
jgi:hypothetical protein